MKTTFTLKLSFLLAIFLMLNGGSEAQTPKLPIGMNIHGITYYTEGPYFTDVMKTSGNWLTFNAEGSSPWNTNYEAVMPKDASGYPLKMPFTPEGGVPQVCRFLFNNYYTGRYVILYDGVGTLKVNGLTHETVDGKLYMTLDGTGGHKWIDILESQEGNHIRNIRILPDEYADAPASAPLFVQDFLDGLRPFHALRFMDWMRTNNSSQEVWSDRVLPTYFTMGTKGVAIEYAIQLCNELKMDAWFCTPHKADDNYITNFARMVRDNLDPDLKVYIECSNEIWNWQFDQASYILNNAPGHRNSYVSADLAAIDPTSKHPEKDAYMMARTFRVWEAEFADQPAERLVRVATGQHGYMDNTRRVLKYLYEVDGNGCDMFAVGGYFNFKGDDHTRWLDMCTNQGTLVTPEEILDSASAAYDQHERNFTLKTAEYVNQYPGVKYAVYEGGQHMQPYKQQDHCYNQSVYDSQIHPKMYDVYMKNFEQHVDPYVDCQLFMAFSYAGKRESKYGSWGHLENYAQLHQNLMEVAPKYQALLDANLPKALPNLKPAVTLTSPASGASFTAGTRVTLTADATDTDGTVSLVEFFSGTTKLGQSASGPYTLEVNITGGTHHLFAVATDDKGAKDTSAVATVTAVNQVLQAKNLLSAINMDGIPDEHVWELSASIQNVISGTSENQAQFAALWDNEYLYVAFDVTDDVLIKDSEIFHLDDAVEIYIDADFNKGTSYDEFDRQFMIRSNDTVWEQNAYTADVLHAFAETAGGYSVEVAIPWSGLGITPSQLVKIGFDVGLNDDDNGVERDGQMIWNGNGMNWGNTSAFGELVLSAETVGTVTATTSKAGLYMSAYPNPAHSEIHVDVPFVSEGFQLRVISSTGVVVKEANISGSQANQDITDLPAGLYLLEVVADQEKITRSIIIE